MNSGSRTNLLPVAQRDALAAALRRIETLAVLLCALAERVPCEPLDGAVVGEAGNADW